MKKSIINRCFDGKSMDYAKLCEEMEDLGKRIVAACETNENGIEGMDLPIVLLVLDNLRSTIQGQIQRDPMTEAAYKLLSKEIGAYGVVVQQEGRK